MTRFGWLLRYWRETRGLAQHELAERAGISVRHLSFLETDRSGPSEPTVVRIGQALNLPERECQRLLHAAGFACQWQGAAGVSESMPGQFKRIGPALDAYDPFPAFLTDMAWRIPCLNHGAHSFFTRCTQLNPNLEREPFDVAAIITDPKSLGQIVTNREEVLRQAMEGLFHLQPDPADRETTSRLFATLSEHDPSFGFPTLDADPRQAWQVEAEFEDQGHSFRLELLALPFGGPCAGYGMLITAPVDSASQRSGEAYFQALIDGAG